MKHLEMIEIIAEGLQEIKDKVVFVGGAVAPLYIKNSASDYPRPTEDVDCVIDIVTLGEREKLEKDLREKGFRHDIYGDSPICRWLFKGIKTDIMSTDIRPFGFTNIWYKDGVQNKITYQLPSGTFIYIFSIPYFIASKIEAYKGRSKNDIRWSHDLEDCILILDSQSSLDEFNSAKKTVQTYLKQTLRELLIQDEFIELIESTLKISSVGIGRAKRLILMLNLFTNE